MLRANIFWQLIRYLALYSVNYRVPFVFTCVQLYSSSLLVFHSCSLVFTRVLSCSIRVHSCSIRVHLCSLVFTRVHRCSLVFRLVWSFRSDRFRLPLHLSALCDVFLKCTCFVLFVPSANCRLDKKAAKRLGGNQRKSQSNEHFLTTELVMSQKICLSEK